MKRVLLLGSAGLIGSRVDLELREDHEILRVGRSADADLTADLSRPETVRALQVPDVYAVVHCAGVTDEDFKSRPADAYVQSTLGMQALIDKAVEAKAERFVYISTSHVYGRQAGEIDENSPPDPLSDYAIAHYAAEQTLKRNGSKFKSSAVLRPNAVFGEPVFMDKFDRWSLIPFSFPLEAVYSQKIVLRSSGEQNRNFVSTGDIARYIDRAIGADASGFEVINAVGAETMSVFAFATQAAEQYRQMTGSTCEVRRVNAGTVSEDQFLYRSRVEAGFELSTVEPFLRSFIDRVIRDAGAGVTYTV